MQQYTPDGQAGLACSLVPKGQVAPIVTTQWEGRRRRAYRQCFTQQGLSKVCTWSAAGRKGLMTARQESSREAPYKSGVGSCGSACPGV